MKNNKAKVLAFMNALETNEQFSGYDAADLGYAGDQQDLGFGGKVCAVRHDVASPYIVNIVNSTGAALTAILFGHNIYAATANYGSAVGLVVTNAADPNGSYYQLLSQSATKPFVVNRWRFISSTTSQLSQTMTVTFTEANGRRVTLPISLVVHKDAFQNATDSVDVTYPLKIDGDTYLSISIVAGATLTLVMFPSQIADVSALMTQQTAVRPYADPVLSLAEPTGGLATGTALPVAGIKK